MTPLASLVVSMSDMLYPAYFFIAFQVPEILYSSAFFTACSYFVAL